MANITIVAKTFHMGNYQEVYRQIHPIMINYEDLRLDEREHMPAIDLLSCGTTMEERIFHLRRGTLSLTANVKDTPKDSVLAIWGMWEVERFREKYNIANIFQIDEGYSWILEPFTLEIEIYRVELQVTVIFGEQSAANFAECYIEVVESNIVVIISGGSKITISKKYQVPVVISGERSYNPNKKTKRRDLQFSWTCSPQCDNLIRKHAYGQIAIPSDLIEFGKT